MRVTFKKGASSYIIERGVRRFRGTEAHGPWSGIAAQCGASYCGAGDSRDDVANSLPLCLRVRSLSKKEPKRYKSARWKGGQHRPASELYFT